MNNYEDWAQLVAKRLQGEAAIIAAIEKDELDDTGATEAFARAVLEPFLPENYGIGAGRVVDAFGNYSDYLDLIIYNRDFPRIEMRGVNDTYLYESVLAAFAVRAKFIRKTFFDALNACASLSHLQTNLDKTVLIKLARKNGLRPGPNKTFVHDDPLRTARFELIGRPPAFVFGFSGIKHSYRQLQENIELWIENRHKVSIATPMKSLPAVIATQGCFAWRNAAPLALSNREMLGIGNDDAPIRLIVLQLLYLLNRRLNVTSDGYGLKPNLSAYLGQFSAPKFELGVGDVAAAADLENASGSQPGARAARDTQRFEPARDHSAAAELAAAAKHEAAAAAALQAASRHQAVAAAELEAASHAEPAAIEKTPPQPAKSEAKSGESAVFDKPSPFASAPIPPAQPETRADDAASFDKPSPFASAPIPPAQPETRADDAATFDKPSPFKSAPAAEVPMPEPEMPRSPAPAAPLGSAPIPPMQSTPAAASEAAAKPAKDVIPPKPPVDIELDSDQGATAAQDDEDEFINTVIIPPNAAASAKDTTRNSTDAFIARVKQQLSGSEPVADNEKDFTSTIPQ